MLTTRPGSSVGRAPPRIGVVQGSIPGQVTFGSQQAHPSKNVLKHVGMNTNGFTPNLTFPLDNGICPGCTQGKMHNQSFPISGKRASEPFKLIHADLIELPI